MISEFEIASIAIPPLGCGNGGLAWSSVEPLIVEALGDLPELDALVYAPDTPPAAHDMVSATPRPTMTVGRAALVTLVTKYTQAAMQATPLEIQKLMYFLQVAGEPLQLRYTKGHYGPYADNLRHVLIAVEGHFLTGYGDGTSRVLEAEPIRPVSGIEKEVDHVLSEYPETVERIQLVSDIINGFESMYGMELLSTVHWATEHNKDAAENWRNAAEFVRKWTSRKARMFTDDHVRAAWDTLFDHGLIPELSNGRP